MRRSLTLALVLALGSCLGEEGDAHFISAKVYGVPWSAPAADGTIVFTPAQPDGPGVVYSEGTRRFGAGSRSITLGLAVPPDTGAYLIDGVDVQASFIDCVGADLASCADFQAMGAAGDTLRITRVDPGSGIIEGTFKFYGHPAGADEVGPTISDGRFRISAPSVFTLE